MATKSCNEEASFMVAEGSAILKTTNGRSWLESGGRQYEERRSYCSDGGEVGGVDDDMDNTVGDQR